MDLKVRRLESAHVHLLGFQMGVHGDALRELAEALGDRLATWPYYREDGEWIGFWFSQISARRAAGTLIPYAVFRPFSSELVGLTAYLSPDDRSKTVEVGMTIYADAAQGTAINPATKRLMLGHAFGKGAERIQFNVDARNERSRAAVMKLGAVQEGILRRNRKLANGFQRDTVVYSILADEWPAVRTGLDRRLAAFKGVGE